jgi:hypothetical protein
MLSQDLVSRELSALGALVDALLACAARDPSLIARCAAILPIAAEAVPAALAPACTPESFSAA